MCVGFAGLGQIPDLLIGQRIHSPLTIRHLRGHPHRLLQGIIHITMRLMIELGRGWFRLSEARLSLNLSPHYLQELRFRHMFVIFAGCCLRLGLREL
jgi:hypothetical protein